MGIKSEVNKYLSDFSNNKLDKPEVCEICNRSGYIIWWSKYIRSLVTFSEVFTEIPIKRVRCCACRKTFCVLPDFIMKFCRYGKDIIIFVLRKLKKLAYEKVAEKLLLSLDIEVAVHTLILWKRKYVLANL